MLLFTFFLFTKYLSNLSNAIKDDVDKDKLFDDLTFLFNKKDEKVGSKKISKEDENKSDEKENEIFEACKNGELERIKVLFFYDENCINLHQKSDGKTPLMIAIDNKNVEIVKFLLSAGADVEAEDNLKLNPFHYAVLSDSRPIVSLIIGYPYSILETEVIKSKEQLLMKECYKGNITNVKELVESGVDVNFKDKEGKTPLIEAVIGRSIKTVGYLIDNGSDVKYIRNNGEGILTYAIYQQDIKMIKFLLKKGAPITKTIKAALSLIQGKEL